MSYTWLLMPVLQASANVFMQFLLAPPPCCIYLQAVPCDPARAHFNFAALSFNSKFLHQIYLIPLHPHSFIQKQRALLLSDGAI